ncbi:hypothetical protein PIB30_060981 [Stylosanthes scabra]|uniref:Uncharacterized protein n=1 Tax=Stylosanthes scabra TaxID=79078 RepID=A0ABU6UK89_9FABA|nr:hypothetical protein [Stylosanthes scabra]
MVVPWVGYSRRNLPTITKAYVIDGKIEEAATKSDEVLEKLVLTVAQAVEDRIDDEIVILNILNPDDLVGQREHSLQQLKMAEKRKNRLQGGRRTLTIIGIATNQSPLTSPLAGSTENTGAEHGIREQGKPPFKGGG